MDPEAERSLGGKRRYCRSSSQPGGPSEFDLVISDLGLPDFSGTELMTILRERHSLRGVALSGYGMEEDIRRSKSAGV